MAWLNTLYFYVNEHVLIVCSKDGKHNSTTEVITQRQRCTKLRNCVAKKVTASDMFVRVQFMQQSSISSTSVVKPICHAQIINQLQIVIVDGGWSNKRALANRIKNLCLTSHTHFFMCFRSCFLKEKCIELSTDMGLLHLWITESRRSHFLI